MSRLLDQLGVILQHILKILKLIMFHDNNSQLVVNLNYQLVKKDLAFMLTTSFYMPCYSIKLS